MLIFRQRSSLTICYQNLILLVVPKLDIYVLTGFNESNIALLHEGLIGIARLCEVQNSLSTPYGEKFVIDGEMLAPNGNFIFLRTVWIIDKGQSHPRFVTAYPE